jgi:uncharacterized phiE125 gp8 family phage protein
MSSRLIVSPAALAVSMEAARAAARVDVDENGVSALDAQIEQAVRTITEKAEHETGRAFIEQTWRLTLDQFPTAPRGGSGAVQLPKAPLMSVEHVKFYDLDGIQQTLDPQDTLLDAESEPGYVVPAPGLAWPVTADRINAVEVQFVCGYGPTHDSVPDAIKGYILAHVQQQFSPVPNAKPENFDRLLDRYRIYL